MNCLIANGRIVTKSTVYNADIRVIDGKIAEIGSPLVWHEGERVVDAAGKYVLPGGVDPHTHFALAGANATSDDFASGSRAALCGGTTTIIDFVTPSAGQTLVQAFLERKQQADSEIYCDYSLHVSPLAEHDNADFESDLDYLISEFGVSSAKVYLAYPSMMIGDKFLCRVLDFAAKRNLLISAHCESGAAAEWLEQSARNNDETSLGYYPKYRSDELEVESVNRFLSAAAITGAAVYVVHVSSKRALDIIKWRTFGGQHIVTETCPHYLYLNDSLYQLGADAARYMMAPPLRSLDDKVALCNALTEKSINTIGSDHCAINLAKRLSMLDDFTRIPKGLPGVEHRYILLLSMLVEQGERGLQRAISLCAENPARVFGLGTAKGSIEIGKDADIVLYDAHASTTINASSQNQAVDYTPYENYVLRGSIDLVLLKGETVYKNTVFCGSARGAYLRRDPYSKTNLED